MSHHSCNQNNAVWRRNPHASEVIKAAPKKDLGGGDKYGPTGPAGTPVGILHTILLFYTS